MNKGYITAGEMTNFTAIICGMLPVALVLFLLSLDLEDDQREQAPDNRIRYVLRDQNGCELMTCTGGPEAIRACLEASRLLEEKEKN